MWLTVNRQTAESTVSDRHSVSRYFKTPLYIISAELQVLLAPEKTLNRKIQFKNAISRHYKTLKFPFAFAWLIYRD